jgi:hypothetical protein
MDRTGGIAIGVVGAVTLLALYGFLVWRQNRWQRVIWAFKVPSDQRPKIIIESIPGEKTVLYQRPSAGFGAVAAVAHLSTALNGSRSGRVRRTARSLEHPVELSFSSEQKADTWCSTADTVVVGGPKTNGITAQVLRQFGCQPSGAEPSDEAREEAGEQLRSRTADLRNGGAPEAPAAEGLGVATLGNAIYWFGDDYRGSVGVDDQPLPGASGYTGDDYGVVLRLPSPTNGDRRMVVVFGSQTFGVDAAASWLANLRRRTTAGRVRKIMSKNRNVAVLIKAPVKDGEIGDLELVDLVVLPDLLVPRHG